VVGFGKRPACRVVVISTAGGTDLDRPGKFRQLAESEADWLLSPRAMCLVIRPEWVGAATADLAAACLRPAASVPVDRRVGAWLSGDQVDACFGGRSRRRPGRGGIGLDWESAGIGPSLRWSSGRALVVVRHLRPTPRPGGIGSTSPNRGDGGTAGDEVSGPVSYDPYQCVGLAQRLTNRGVRMVEYPFTGTTDGSCSGPSSIW